jgi:hypothetical protein
MTNPQNRNPNNSEDTINKEKAQSYGDGYVDGNVDGNISKHRLQKETQEVRDQNNTAGGLIVGIFITALLGIVGLSYFLWGRSQPAVNTPVIVVPTPAASQSPTASQEPTKQITIIEKTNTVERVPVIVPAPQQSAPNVNITVPPSQAPNNPPPAPVPQNTTINIAPPPSSGQTPKSAPSPETETPTSSKTPVSPPPKTDSAGDRNSTDSNP